MEYVQPDPILSAQLDSSKTLRWVDVNTAWLRYAKSGSDDEDSRSPCQSVSSPSSLSSDDMEDVAQPMGRGETSPDCEMVEAPTGSRLLCLPTEVREIILRHVLTVPGDQDVPIIYSPSRARGGSRLSVLEVCSQLHDEGLPLFYGTNRLHFSLPVQLYRFLVGISRTRRRLIRRLSVGGWSYVHYTGYELSKQAFSCLGLCPRLEEFHLALHTYWPIVTEEDMIWQRIFQKSWGEVVLPLVDPWTGQVRAVHQGAAYPALVFGISNYVLGEMAGGAKALSNLRNLRVLRVTYKRYDVGLSCVMTSVDEMPGEWADRWLRRLVEGSKRPRSGAVAAHKRLSEATAQLGPRKRL